MQLRDFLPKSLYARAVLIVILPIFLMQASVTYGFFVSHWRSVSGRLSESVAGDIAATTRLWTEARSIGQEAEIERLAFDNLHLSVKFVPGERIPPTDKTSIYGLLNQTLEGALDDSLDRPYWFNTRGYPAYVEIAVELDSGRLNFIVLKDRVYATNGHLFFAWMVGSTLLLGWIAILFLRNQVRSIQRLAQAAEDFGRGRDAPDFRPAGATEVRKAGRAFIAMRERIKRHLHQRTSLLAGVSHDLRTPITRIKLSLEMMDETEEVKALKGDLDQMQAMLNGYLAFARDQAAEETEAVDIAEMVAEVREDARRMGRTIEAEAPKGLIVAVRPMSFKRALTNLVGNALRHADAVRVEALRDGEIIEIRVDDDGPGIPEEQRDEAFRPFQRLDDARNQNTTGVGLGLAVVRDVVRAHGGDVALSTAPLGGLRASMRIPA